jgi:hypothetical protein
MNGEHSNSPAPQTTDRSVIGRLAHRPWREGDELPEVGSECLVSGPHCDIESDQHRSYSWRRVIGYSVNNKFVCLQTRDCWPTVERVENCWFADKRLLLNAAAPDLLRAARLAVQYLNADSTPLNNGDIAVKLAAAIAKAEGRSHE